MRERRLVIAAVILLASCADKRNVALQDAARKANPVITSLRQPLQTLFDSNVAAPQAVAACKEAIDLAGRLAGLDLDDKQLGSDGDLSIQDVVHGLSFEPATRCKPDAGDGVHDAKCLMWCRERFTQLSNAIERARQHASRNDVKIEPLR